MIHGGKNVRETFCFKFVKIIRIAVDSIAVYIHSGILLIVLSILQYNTFKNIADSIKYIVIYIQEYS